MKKTKYFILFLMLISCVNAVKISEIMYNPLGSDSDREWIEIYNSGPETNIENWKFRENNVNHQLSLYQGSFSIPQNGFAIIVDDPQEFLKDYTYTGTILDSSFSLRNSGEEIALLDDNLNQIDVADYKDIAEEGHSLVFSDGEWKEGVLNGNPGEKREIVEEVPEFKIIGLISIIAVIILYRLIT